MNQNSSSSTRFRLWKRWIPLTTTLGVGGTSLAIWFEEISTFLAEFIGVIVLSVLAGVIYLFDIYIFKSVNPTADDIKK